ncbi:hypothetical protein WH8501_27320 [Crocosphaera watsonii WH 8501]|uniref:hypothetical protein n=1 Tax=Crocosphaera TaxID=263510 RepID=UPI000045F006|nr:MULTISPECIES: hypothetical protein [Crocosphaera]MCH2244153.1 hypothetical protein [Crocosphaera sp.]NQZ64150.1 hypothetical protein [Crocosphaera sp.]
MFISEHRIARSQDFSLDDYCLYSPKGLTTGFSLDDDYVYRPKGLTTGFRLFLLT